LVLLRNLLLGRQRPVSVSFVVFATNSGVMGTGPNPESGS
jgi:hypothetical protein